MSLSKKEFCVHIDLHAQMCPVWKKQFFRIHAYFDTADTLFPLAYVFCTFWLKYHLTFIYMQVDPHEAVFLWSSSKKEFFLLLLTFTLTVRTVHTCCMSMECVLLL